MANIVANVARMFESVEPWDCSNNAMNLGENVGQITWHNALSVAEAHARWLETPIADACEGMREWAGDTGAWDADEIAGWSAVECLALFVQNVASDLRDHLDADNQDFEACVETYDSTDWGTQSSYPTGSYYFDADSDGVRTVKVEYYTGC
jgi:hypothetical protein